VTKVFVFAYDRYDTMTTPRLLEASGIKPTVLCHSSNDIQRFLDGGTASEGTIIATGEPKGLGRQRNAALEMMEDGEWAMFLVDDLFRFTELATYDTEPYPIIPVDISNSAEWGRAFKKEIDIVQLLQRGLEDTAYCDAIGSHLLGWSSNANPLFRKKRYTHNVLADGRAWMVKKSDLRFDVNVQTIDDYGWTAANIVRHGISVTNNWILPEAKRFTIGGYGTQEARLEQKMRDCAYLVERYPNIVHYKSKKNTPDRAHVTIRVTRN
jgi:hypothetical protein